MQNDKEEDADEDAKKNLANLENNLAMQRSFLLYKTISFAFLNKVRSMKMPCQGGKKQLFIPALLCCFIGVYCGGVIGKSTARIWFTKC